MSDITMLERLKLSLAYQTASDEEKAEMVEEFLKSCEGGTK